MPGEPVKSNIVEIAQLLKLREKISHPTVLFLGSRAGGLFRSLAFIDTIQPAPEPNAIALPHQEQFAELYQFLQKVGFGKGELHSFLTDCLRKVALTEADMGLAALIKLGLFNVIISTNIDDLLEQALNKVGMRKPFDFEIVLPDQSQNLETRFTKKLLPYQIIKSFGDHAAYSYRIVKRTGYLDSIPQLRRLLEDTLIKDILVVGLDANWDEEIVRAFRPQADSLWFVHEENLLEHPHVSHIFQGRQQVRYITGQEGSYETFFKMLYEYFVKGTPDTAEQRPLENFVNRTFELKMIDEAFETLSESDFLLNTPILAFHGVGGIGKTAMLEQIKQRCGDENLPCITTHAQQDIPGISRSILEQVNNYRNVQGLMERESDWLDRSIIATKELLKQGPAVMLLDALDPNDTEQVRWLEELLGHVLLGNKLFVALTSKQKLIFKQDRSVTRRVKSLELKSLDRESCREYLSKPNLQLEAEVRDMVFEWTHGYPLAMQVMKESVAAGLDPRKAEDRQSILEAIVTQVITQKVLARVKPARMSWYYGILRLLSVPRRFKLAMMRDLIEQFAPEFRRESNIAYFALPKEIYEATGILSWNMLRAGFSVDTSVRNIFLLDLKIREPESHYAIHDFLARLNQESMTKVVGLDRVRYLREYLYHLACKGDTNDLLEQIRQAVQQTAEESPETLLQFSEEFTQDEELQETLGAYKNEALSLIHAIQAQLYREFGLEDSPPEG